ncbi:MAG: ABC-three component system protein [Methylococcaceae bacterium]
MKTQKTHEEKTAAADKSIGFDYQYYYFLYRVLKLGKNQSVGLEVKDDVHTELDNDYQFLIQLKHTTQKNADNTPKNLTNFDLDLWKTLSNWSKVITDNVEGRNEKEKQHNFIKKTDFMLVTNKSYTKNCEFLSILDLPSNDDVKQKLVNLKTKTNDNAIKGYIDDILELEDSILALFITHIYIETECNQIIERCKEAIIEHHVPDNTVEQLFRDLDSAIRQDNFIKISNNEKIIITFDDFNKKYRRYFDIARNPNLKIKKYYQPLPTELNKQTFIRQLVDINDIEEKDENDMRDYTHYMLDTRNTLESSIQEGNLTNKEVEEFNKEAKNRWKTKFKSLYRQNKSVEKALELLDKVREENLSINNQQMGTIFSNGTYYYLSDLPEIGWLSDWENKYK